MTKIRNKYDFLRLETYCNENNIKLLHDYKNITVEGNYVKSKRLVDYHKEQKTEKGEAYWSAISVYTFDCMKRLQQVERFRYTDRMGGGTRLENDLFKSEWESVVAGTPNDNYLMRACAFRG